MKQTVSAPLRPPWAAARRGREVLGAGGSRGVDALVPQHSGGAEVGLPRAQAGGAHVMRDPLIGQHAIPTRPAPWHAALAGADPLTTLAVRQARLSSAQGPGVGSALHPPGHLGRDGALYGDSLGEGEVIEPTDHPAYLSKGRLELLGRGGLRQGPLQPVQIIAARAGLDHGALLHQSRLDGRLLGWGGDRPRDL